MINWSATKEEYLLIAEITKRAVNFIVPPKWVGNAFDFEYLTLNMDITAAHANGNELELQALLEADDFNFFHDILGITKNINRETGRLENCFSPRYSK